MNELKHIIYQITNLLNDRIYIGKHSTTTPYDMKRYWSSSKRLKNTIKKYGKKNFKRETLFVFDTEDEAFQREEEIVTLEFVAREDTYNLRVGGKGSACGENNHNWGKCPSEETKKRLSENHWDNSGENHPNWGKHHSEETKKKMSEAQKGEKNHNFGKTGENNPAYGTHRSEETKKKMSEAHKGLMVGENNPNWGKHLSDETKQKMRENYKDRSGRNNGFYGKTHTEETRQKMSLPMEIIQQRREDIKNIPKVRGWKTKLAKKWNKSGATVPWFINKYASDLIIKS